MGVLRAHTGAIGCIGLKLQMKLMRECCVAGKRDIVEQREHSVFPHQWKRLCGDTKVSRRLVGTVIASVVDPS